MSDAGLRARAYSYFDIKTHLENVFGAAFQFVMEKVQNINRSQIDQTKILVVARQLRGVLYSDSAQMPFQLDFYLKHPETELDVINQTIGLGNRNTIQYSGYAVSSNIGSPSLMEVTDEFGLNGYSRYSSIAYFFVYDDLKDIVSLTIDGESIDFIDCSFSYVSEGTPSKKTGSYIMGNDPSAGTTTFSLTALNKPTAFWSNLKSLRLGQQSATLSFEIVATYKDGSTETHDMVVAQATQSHAKAGKLPTIQVSFREAM